MIQLKAAHEVRDGDWVIREPFDSSLRPSDYDESQAVQVVHVSHDSDRLAYGRQAHICFGVADYEHIGLNTKVLVCTQDREQAVPCRRCSSTTWNNDAVCNRCKEN